MKFNMYQTLRMRNACTPWKLGFQSYGQTICIKLTSLNVVPPFLRAASPNCMWAYPHSLAQSFVHPYRIQDNIFISNYKVKCCNEKTDWSRMAADLNRVLWAMSSFVCEFSFLLPLSPALFLSVSLSVSLSVCFSPPLSASVFFLSLSVSLSLTFALSLLFFSPVFHIALCGLWHLKKDHSIFLFS